MNRIPNHRTRRRSTTSLSLLAPTVLAAAASVAGAQCDQNEDYKILASDGYAFQGFGRELSSDGAVTAVGVPSDDTLGSDLGAVYVLRFDGTAWNEEQKLLPSRLDRQYFGQSVSVSGGRIAVGQTDTAYVFAFDGTTWNEEQRLEVYPSEHFGAAVALDGSNLFVGDPYHLVGVTPRAGRVYWFERSGTWVERQQITSPLPMEYARFGWSLSTDRDLLAIGEPEGFASGWSSGLVHTFRHDGVQYVREGHLNPPSPDDDDYFGTSVAVTGDVVVVGSPGDDDTGAMDGAVYFFQYDGALWQEISKMLPSEPDSGERLGDRVDALGSMAIAGAASRQPCCPGTGVAYLYRFDGSRMVEQQILRPSDGVDGDWFGSSVSMTPTGAMVGAINDDNWGTSSGSTYAFRLSDLALEADPNAVNAGDTLTIGSCGGLQGAAVALFTVVNGTPFVFYLGTRLFDANGYYSQATPVPPGLSGVTLTLVSIGFYQPTRLGISNLETVSFL